MYESGVTQSYLNLVSEVTSLTEFMNLSEYVEQISAYDTMMLERFRATREFIQQEEAELQREHEALEVLRADQQEKRNQVNSLVNQTQSALSNKEGQISQKENEVTAQEEVGETPHNDNKKERKNDERHECRRLDAVGVYMKTSFFA